MSLEKVEGGTSGHGVTALSLKIKGVRRIADVFTN